MQSLFSNVKYQSPTLNAWCPTTKISIADCQLTKLRPSWPHHCYIWHQNPFAFNLDVMSNSLLICERPLPHFPIQGSLKVQKMSFLFTISPKITFRCPSDPILILLHLIKNIFFHFSTKISKLTLPFQRATSSIWAFAKSPNPSDPQALQPPNTGKNTQSKESSWTLNSLKIASPNRIQKSTQYIYFFPKCICAV